MHVVFGAAGALGAAIVQNLSQQNKAVRAVVKDAGHAVMVQYPEKIGKIVNTFLSTTENHPS